MKKKSLLIFLLILSVSFLYETVSYAVTLELNSSQTVLSPKDSLTVNIIAKNATELSGAVLSLEFPESVFTLEETPVTTDFFKSQSPFTEEASSVWSANTDTKGELYLAGVAMNRDSGDEILPDELTLFSVHFSVKAGGAGAGPQVITLIQSSLCNGPAGWGNDRNNNAKYNPGDTYEKASLLYTVTVDSQTGQQVDSSVINADVMLETITPAPSLILTVLPKGTDSSQDTDNDISVDECPYDSSKLTSGECGCGVPDTDSDGDGVPNCMDIMIYPVNGATDVSLTPLFEIAPYPDFENARVNAGIIWQISRTSDFSDLVFERVGAPDQFIIQLPDFILDAQATYFWRISYDDGSWPLVSWDAVAKFTTGLDHTIDFNENGIPDHQDVSHKDNLIAEIHSEINEADLLVVQTANNGFQYGLVPGFGVAGIDRMKWVSGDEIDGSDQWTVAFPFGLISFRVYTEVIGDTVTLQAYFSSTIQGLTWWKYVSMDNAVYDYSQFVTFSDDMMSALITIEDGGAGDADGVANGVIVDPSGLQGVLDTGVEDTDDETDTPKGKKNKK